ncbi:hypothetical protein [Lactovum odontotermitis]
MGLVYDPAEAEKIIISMEKNIETCQDKLDSLKGACRRVTGALSGPTLSGAATLQLMVCSTASSAQPYQTPKLHWTASDPILPSSRRPSAEPAVNYSMKTN